MEETQQQKNIFGFLQSFIYFFIGLHLYVHLFASRSDKHVVWGTINKILYKLSAITHSGFNHLIAVAMILLVSMATRAKKTPEYKVSKGFFLPLAVGTVLYGLSLYVYYYLNFSAFGLLYAFSYMTGAILLHVAFSNLSKLISFNKDDLWNTEEESFPQNKVLVSSPYSFNLPIHYYHGRRVHQGWMNINPFRGLLVMGVPGSGKTASVIVPYIKQLLAKGFSMVVYDFKFPDLAKMVYYHYNLHRRCGALAQHEFYCISIDNVDISYRCNPLRADYITSLGEASETADAIVSSLLKSDKQSGSSQFFTQSAINFLSAVIYFLATYEKGRYSTLPHVLAFISQPYEEIFNTLFSNPELISLLAPFKSAFENRAFDQLEGQIGTVRINLSRISTAESFWVFSGNDVDLKISNPPSVLVLANSPATQNINSAFYAAVLMRLTKLINSKGNHPSAIVVDECPTLFLHKVENLVATARSNKVAVALGLQELPQFNQQYGKEVASSIVSIMGSVISGAVRNKETLEWLEKLFGKIKQTSKGLSVDRTRATVNLNTRMDAVIPAARIANQNAGEVVGIVSKESDDDFGKYTPNLFSCKVAIDFKANAEEEKKYQDFPKVYDFGSGEEKRKLLIQNMMRIYEEVREITCTA